MKYIRNDKRYKKCLIYSQIECLEPTQAESIGRAMSQRHLAPLKHYIRRSERDLGMDKARIGVVTGAADGFTKLDYRDNGSACFQQCRFKIEERLVGPSPEADLLELKTQLRQLENIIIEPTTPVGKPRETISGKGYNRHDDLAIVLLLSITATTAILDDGALIEGIRKDSFDVLVH